MIVKQASHATASEVASDAEIIAASCAEPHHFGLIFERHFRAVYGFLYHRLDSSAAEDAASEVFEIALSSRAKFTAQHDSALPWLYGIAANVAAKRHRSTLRQRRAFAKAASQTETSTTGPSTGSISRIDAQSAAAKLKPFLAALTERDQSILHLFIYSELNMNQIAQALKIPPGTVRSRLHRLRKQLQHQLNTSEGELA